MNERGGELPRTSLEERVELELEDDLLDRALALAFGPLADEHGEALLSGTRLPRRAILEVDGDASTASANSNGP